MSVGYNLEELENINMQEIIKDEDFTKIESLKLIHKYWRHRDQNYNILKYDKEHLTLDCVNTIGLFRSMIYKNNQIMAFSPPKSYQHDLFKKMYPICECVGEEFVEGTMINVFFDKDLNDEGDWEMATRSTVGGKICYFKVGEYDYKKSFRYMFLDVCESVGLNFDILPKEYCYTFVFQHPHNRIVIPFSEKNLYLVKVYKIEDYKIVDIPCENILAYLKNTQVRLPKKIELTTYDDLYHKMQDLDDYKMVGIMINHKKTGTRTKIRNAAYEEIRLLRGNQPKLQYRYLELRKQNKLNDYLLYFPESRGEFSKYRDQLYKFTRNLHTNYVRCFVKKIKPLKEFQYQYRTHMYQLHQLYLQDTSNIIMFDRVKNYINDLPVASLMYSLNYYLRKQTTDCEEQKSGI
jgi:hypothetical protein